MKKEWINGRQKFEEYMLTKYRLQKAYMYTVVPILSVHHYPYQFLKLGPYRVTFRAWNMTLAQYK